MTDQDVINATKDALHQIEHDRIAHNMELLRRAPVPVLLRLRDAARLLEATGWKLDAMEESALFDYVIKQRSGDAPTLL